MHIIAVSVTDETPAAAAAAAAGLQRAPPARRPPAPNIGGLVVQWLGCPTYDSKVAGSTPGRSNFKFQIYFFRSFNFHIFKLHFST